MYLREISSIPFLLLFTLFILGGCASTKQQRVPPRPQPPIQQDQVPEPAYSEPVFVTPSPLTLLSKSPFPSIKAKIDSLIPDSLFPPAHLGIKIVSLQTGESLYELNATSLFNPASNQKLFTAGAALELLGRDFPLSTVVSVDTASNTIFIKGFGDAVFSTENLDSLAKLTLPALSPGRTWKVAGDVSYFDSVFWGYGWNWDDEPAAYQMFLTPLILNGNTIKLHASPGIREGDSLTVRTEPVTSFVSIENNGKTRKDSVTSRLKLSRKWLERLNVLTVDGEMLLRGGTDSSVLSVWKPEQYTTHVFAERLQNMGAGISATTIDTLSTSAFEVARYTHPLDSVVTYMNKVSDNLSAETLLKILAAEIKGKPGSAEMGVAVIREFLGQHDVDTNAIRIVDGSGLSRMNLTSPATVVKLLEIMYASSEFVAFYNSLPIAGVDGTIESRMRRTSGEGNVRAKTGTLTAVTSLSGYLQAADGEWLAFSIMITNYPTQARVYRQVQDRIAVFLSKIRRESL